MSMASHIEIMIVSAAGRVSTILEYGTFEATTPYDTI